MRIGATLGSDSERSCQRILFAEIGGFPKGLPLFSFFSFPIGHYFSPTASRLSRRYEDIRNYKQRKRGLQPSQ